MPDRTLTCSPRGQPHRARRILNFLSTELEKTSLEARYFGSFYLVAIMVFELTGWSFGAYRSLALMAMLLLVLTATFMSWRPNLAVVRWIRTVLPGCMLAVSLVPFRDAWRSLYAGHRVRALDSLIVGCVIMAVFLLTCVPRLRDRPAFRNAAILVLLGALLIPLANIVSGLAVYKLDLVAGTTAEAARAMWAGLNPYDVRLDYYGATIVHDAAYGGYKYLPGMPILYGPLIILTGARSVLLTNAVLCTATAAAVFCLSRKLAGEARYFPILLFLSTPIVSVQALAEGATDAAPILLVLVAFLQWGRSSFLAGVLIGLSLSMKPVPALFAAMLLVPSEKEEWGHYIAGIVLGALPVLPYLAWSPRSFLNNVVFFNLIRPPDSTTWRYHAPVWAGRVAMMASVLTWVSVCLWCFVARVGLRARLYAFFVITLGVILAASSDHDNYALWWTPVLVILLGTLGARPRSSAAA
jgi:hypothetical protein